MRVKLDKPFPEMTDLDKFIEYLEAKGDFNFKGGEWIAVDDKIYLYDYEGKFIGTVGNKR